MFKSFKSILFSSEKFSPIVLNRAVNGLQASVHQFSKLYYDMVNNYAAKSEAGFFLNQIALTDSDFLKEWL